jgi:uncharacterized membrane protein
VESLRPASGGKSRATIRLSLRVNVGKFVDLTRHQEALLSLIVGIYLIIRGLTSDVLISESVISATKEDLANAKATPFLRAVVVGAGLVAVLYGSYLLFH